MLTTNDVLKLTKVLKEHFYGKDASDSKFEGLEKKIDALQTSVDNLTQMVKGFQEEMIANRKRIDRLEEWAKKVAEKTGIPMPF